jgi:hypothetical protein
MTIDRSPVRVLEAVFVSQVIIYGFTGVTPVETSRNLFT